MSRLIPILLLGALVLQTGFKLAIYFDYEINKELITLKYCENKAKPALKCHGKCHLNKLLKEDDKRNEQGKGSVKDGAELSPYIPQNTQTFRAQSENEAGDSFLYLFKKTKPRAVSFFHPPSCL